MSNFQKLMHQQSLDEAERALMYAILVEVDDETAENFLSFIQYQGNETELKALETALEGAKPQTIPEGMAVFYLDIGSLVSDVTATEMAQTHISVTVPPQKLNGKLKLPNFNIKPEDNDTIRARKIYKYLGGGKIKNYINL